MVLPTTSAADADANADADADATNQSKPNEALEGIVVVQEESGSCVYIHLFVCKKCRLWSCPSESKDEECEISRRSSEIFCCH